MGNTPKLIYFPIQGKGEVIKLALAAAGVEFEHEDVNKEEMKADLDHYKFGQVPRYVDDEVDLCQMHAILRHIGRKYGLVGKTEAQHAAVEEVIEGSTDLTSGVGRGYMAATTKEEYDAFKEKFWKEHLEPGTETAPESRGAHAAYLSRILAANKSGYFVGDGLTIADLAVASTIDAVVMRMYKERLREAWPDLVEHHDRVWGQEKIAAYLQGPQRPPPMPLKYVDDE
ncbi:hypothetical protein N2152v2_000141 [Parachlorella kessleri]